MGHNTPRFTQPHGEYLYARLRAVHNHCESWDNLRTVWLSLTADETDQAGHWVHPLKHDDGFRSEAVKKSVSRARNSLDLNQWAGYWIMAPRRTGYSHKHYCLWLDTQQSIEQIESAFEKVVRSHIRAHDSASSEGNPVGKAVQVRSNSDCETILPELGHNIPELGVDTDVRNLGQDWHGAQLWAAMYWVDDRIRQYELGQFASIADRARNQDQPDGGWQYKLGWQN